MTTPIGPPPTHVNPAPRSGFLPPELAQTNFYIVGRLPDGRPGSFVIATAPVGCPRCRMTKMMFVIEETSWACLLCADGF